MGKEGLTISPDRKSSATKIFNELTQKGSNQLLCPKLFVNYLSTFAIFSCFVIYSFFTLSAHPICVPALHTIQHNSPSRFIQRTQSAQIHFSNSIGAFGHRAILIWGDRGMDGGFLLELTYLYRANVPRLPQSETLQTLLIIPRLQSGISMETPKYVQLPC